MDARLEQIFEAWYDYEYSIDEDAKASNRLRRADLIMAALKAAKSSGTVSEFLHCFRDDYQDWAIKRNLKAPKKRF